MNAEIVQLENDIHLFCVKADSFPEGVQAAHQRLTDVAREPMSRNYFGVSYLYDDQIVYMAAAEWKKDKEMFPEECDAYVLKKGAYISIHITDFKKDPSSIGDAFKTLLEDPRIDENGCCAEFYFPTGKNGITAKDVRCMVRLAD